MDRHLLDYYTARSPQYPAGYFHAVIDLETHLKMGWEKLVQICPSLPHGWFELVHLADVDRIELMQEHWLLKISPHPKIKEAIAQFFLSLDHIGVFLSQRNYDDPFEPELIYRLSGSGEFFRGRPGATAEEIGALQKEFVEYILPLDYTSFLRIHDGFSKWRDKGLLGSQDLALACIDLQELLERTSVSISHLSVPSRSLIPFYQSLQGADFQCFWNDGTSLQRLGEGIEPPPTLGVVSIMDPKKEIRSFPTFLDWLIFYLEKIDRYGIC